MYAIVVTDNIIAVSLYIYTLTYRHTNGIVLVGEERAKIKARKTKCFSIFQQTRPVFILIEIQHTNEKMFFSFVCMCMFLSRFQWSFMFPFFLFSSCLYWYFLRIPSFDASAWFICQLHKSHCLKSVTLHSDWSHEATKIFVNLINTTSVCTAGKSCYSYSIRLLHRFVWESLAFLGSYFLFHLFLFSAFCQGSYHYCYTLYICTSCAFRYTFLSPSFPSRQKYSVYETILYFQFQYTYLLFTILQRTSCEKFIWKKPTEKSNMKAVETFRLVHTHILRLMLLIHVSFFVVFRFVVP